MAKSIIFQWKQSLYYDKNDIIQTSPLEGADLELMKTETFVTENYYKCLYFEL